MREIKDFKAPQLKKISDVIWEIDPSYKEGMLVPARIIASEALLKNFDQGVFEQLTNVACLPGIVKPALCMPDGHWGYGFPIGGVAAFDPDNGVISPGGIGFDINCGMRLITTNLTLKDVQPKLRELVDLMFKRIPVGVGCKGFLDVNRRDFAEMMEQGSKWCLERGLAWEKDIKRTEEQGIIDQSDSTKVSEKAFKRGLEQLGTLGSGNHYLEVQVVEKPSIYDEKVAKKFGINADQQIVVMVHCGSRGFGHQIATDYLKIFDDYMHAHKLTAKDRELAYAPFRSQEGQDYFKAMACAANAAFVNRQVILHRVRECFSQVFGKTPEEMEMNLVYDVAHNIAKLEKHKVEGKARQLLVHRKGATRSFGPGSDDLPEEYKDVGQPVIVGGSMETGSFLLCGTKHAMEETFGSTCHGSGRTMSRAQAKHEVRGDQLQKQMEAHGIYVRAASMSGLAEEAGSAYKNISEVVDSVHAADVSRKVVGLRPIGNIKG